MKANSKVVIFDMDGVIFDTVPLAREFFLNLFPGMTHDIYNELHAGNIHEESKKHEHLKRKETEEEKEQSIAKYAEDKSRARMFDGMENLLKELHGKGIVLVLNTNAYRRNTMPLLERFHLKELFDFIADADVSKSKVEKFKLIEEKYGVKKDEVLFVTDSLGDVREAEVAQVPTVAVTWGVHNESYFKRERHENLVAIVHSVDELGSNILH